MRLTDEQLQSEIAARTLRGDGEGDIACALKELLAARRVVEAGRDARDNWYGTTQMKLDAALALYDAES